MPMKPVILLVDANSVHANALREALHGEEAELLPPVRRGSPRLLLTREVVLVVMAARLLQMEGFKLRKRCVEWNVRAP